MIRALALLVLAAVLAVCASWGLLVGGLLGWAIAAAAAAGLVRISGEVLRE
ncbi:hypothetical protein [Geodermatophilus chilensis]|uniref:hypothetical protein n=1 Tax=Geodermatophilus chilensis TaxID=2035835 RepID=UPI0012FFDCD4|nr:hypothetical protein [Geodermatophilus chilensis]